MRFGLRARVALAFGLLSFVIAGAVSGATYSVARWYLLNQREDSAITRAVLDSRSVDASLAADLAPVTALEQVPSVGTSQPMIQVQGVWYTSGLTVPPASLPASLLSIAAKDGGAQQRTTIGDEQYLLVAIQLDTSVYVEVFPLRDLDLVLTIVVGCSLSRLFLLELLESLSAATHLPELFAHCCDWVPVPGGSQVASSQQGSN